MIDDAVSVLKDLLRMNLIYGYLINIVEKESHQLYFVGDKLETVRDGKATSAKVTVYVEHDRALGSASFNVYPSSSSTEIAKQIEEAMANAVGVNDAPYKLVAPEKEKHEEKQRKSLADLSSEIAHEIFSVKGKDGAKLNATEIFLYKTRTQVMNSLCLNKESVSYSGMVETIPTFDGENESVEIYAQKNFGVLQKGEMAKFIDEKLDEVSARAKVTKFNLPSFMDVLIREEEIETMLSEYVSALTYSALSSGSTPLKEGDAIQIGDDSDKITLTMKGEIEGCAGSRHFDMDGSKLIPTTLIKDGVVSSFFGDNQFSQYVGKKNTGNLSLMEVEPGTMESEIEGEYLECLQFSGLQCDLLNDYLGGEVRLALLHKEGKTIPVGGFSISGRLSELLSSLRLSKETVKGPYYFGPKHMLLKKMAVL